jgi:pimeloyl-ACP methyl ester carboxylesterase
MQETLALLKAVPQAPRPLRRLANWPLGLQSVAEYVTHAPSWLSHLSGRINRYPKPFRKVTFHSADGTRLSGWLGHHTLKGRETDHGSRGQPAPREGIVMVPGMFTSKDMTIQKARALKIFRDLGYHVLAMDLRGFGESSRALNSGGWKESEDVEAAVRYFREIVPVTKTHIYAESLGASAALVAAGRLGRRRKKLVDGSLLAVSPFAELEDQVDHLESKATLGEDLYMVQWFFHQLLRLSGSGARDFRQYMQLAADAYETDLATLYHDASPTHWVRTINVPTLILASQDDPVVPVRHAEILAKAVEGLDNPAVWTLPWGSHCLYEMADPRWFWTVLSQFFDFYCLLPEAEPGS